MEKNISAEKALELVEEVASYADIPYMRTHLRKMIDSFLLSKEDHEFNYKQNVYTTFAVLDTFLSKIEVKLD